MRTIKAANASEKSKFKVPRTVQDTLPAQILHDDGIYEFAPIGGISDKTRRFSMCYHLSDINYFSVSQAEQEILFNAYCAFINAMDSGATYKITTSNHFVNRLEFETNILLPQRQDVLGAYRKEYNDMLLSKINANGGIIQDKYITVSVLRKSIEEARSFFQRVSAGMRTHLSKELKSQIMPLDAHERLRIIHDFMRPGEETFYNFDLHKSAQRGHNWKDHVCPDGMEIRADYLRIGEKWARTLYLSDYPSYLRHTMVAKMTELNKQLMLSVDYIPVPKDEAIQDVQRVLLGVNTNIVNYNKRQVKDQSYASVPYAMQQQKEETEIFMKALTEDDEHWIFGLLTLVHVADTKEELDADTDTLMSIAREHVCQLTKPYFRQLDALQTVLPYGVRRLEDVRTMTTSSAATFIPFRSPRLQDKGGIYYGCNPLTKEMLLCDRKNFLNSNGFIFGKSGGGKSFFGKQECLAKILGTNDDMIFLDPDGEYAPLMKALGGETIRISASSATAINALDVNADYYINESNQREDPVIAKTEFVLSLCASILRGMDDKDRSLLDRCAGRVLRKYVDSDYQSDAPTLVDLHAELLNQQETEAKDLALRLESFVNGSLSAFAKQTNVETDARILCFDLKGLGEQLKTLGMLIVLDAVINRVSRNRALGRHTWIYIDEFHVFTANEYARRFLISFWKRARKYGAILTGITQNVGDLVRAEDTQDIIANSEFIVMLAQAPTDRDKFARMFHLSDAQLEYINDAGVGRGLLKCGNAILPFENIFPKNTELYKLMTTKLKEVHL